MGSAGSEPLRQEELKAFLEEKHDQYNRPAFISSDPIQVPHSFSNEKDIEISGFLTAVIAWGQRTTIIRNAFRLMSLMDHAPAGFLLHASGKEWDRFGKFVHRTFNATDTLFFLQTLQRMLKGHGGLKEAFLRGYRRSGSLDDGIRSFREEFFLAPHAARTRKHLPDIDRGASAKRINMFLRWMVRQDPRGVDFGLWKEIPAAALYLPLDVHTGKVARKLGLLQRKQDDWKAVLELTARLREFCPEDPVKYDYALFGLGIFEKF